MMTFTRRVPMYDTKTKGIVTHEIKVTIDPQKLANEMAAAVVASKSKKSRAVKGAITATIA